MVRVNIEEIKGITGERKKSSCAAIGDNAAANEEKGSKQCCKGDECQLEWTDDQLLDSPPQASRGPPCFILTETFKHVSLKMKQKGE